MIRELEYGNAGPCQRCQSKRVVSASAKCSDLFHAAMHGRAECDGYVPDDLGVGGGDYVEIHWCLDCGQLQGEWPLPKSRIER